MKGDSGAYLTLQPLRGGCSDPEYVKGESTPGLSCKVKSWKEPFISSSFTSSPSVRCSLSDGDVITLAVSF